VVGFGRAWKHWNYAVHGDKDDGSGGGSSAISLLSFLSQPLERKEAVEEGRWRRPCAIDWIFQHAGLRAARGGDSLRLKLAERVRSQEGGDVLALPASVGAPTLAQEHSYSEMRDTCVEYSRRRAEAVELVDVRADGDGD
jgi:hypothetical protein